MSVENLNNEQITSESKIKPTKQNWGWVRFGLVFFTLLILYIYNSNHATKALKKKNLLQKELKELHTEKVYLESKVTNASRKSEVSKRLLSKGFEPLSAPPVKIERDSIEK